MDSSYKPIKFFLDVFGHKIHDIEELRSSDNFHLDYIYDLFLDGILERWLQVQGYEAEYKAMSDLPKEPLNVENAKRFCAILRPNDDKAALETIIQNFKTIKKWEARLDAFEGKRADLRDIISKYHADFAGLKASIKANANNMPAIKSLLADMSVNFLHLFNINQDACIYFFKKNAPVAVLLMLANATLRKSLSEADNFDDVARYVRIELSARTDPDDTTEPYPIHRFISPDTDRDEDKNIISTIQIVAQNTNSMWEDIEPNEKDFMILSVTEPASIRPWRKNGCDLPSEEKLNFPIIHGIDYRSNAADPLIFMEI